MSINSITSNPVILQELKNAIGGGGGSGITSLQNTDGNIAVGVAGSVGNIDLEQNITVNQNLNVKGKIELNGASGSSGQILTSQGSGNPIWTTLPSSGVVINNQSITRVPFATNVVDTFDCVTGFTYDDTTSTLSASNLSITNINGSAYPPPATFPAGALKHIYYNLSSNTVQSGSSITLFSNSISGFTTGKNYLVYISYSMFFTSTTGNVNFTVNQNGSNVLTRIMGNNFSNNTREFKTIQFQLTSAGATETLIISEVGTTINLAVNTDDYVSVTIQEIQ